VSRKNQKLEKPLEYARIEFVATPAQKRAWEGAAKREGLSLSAWLVLAAERAVAAQGEGDTEW
jgi:hypothetical protein